MENWEISAALERMAGLLALKGENDFKVRAYSQAARQVIRLAEPLADLVKREELEQLPGVGKALAAKIKELVSTGQSSFLARLESEVPPELLALFSIPGVGYRIAGNLVKSLSLETMEQLEQAARSGQIRSLPRMGSSLEKNIVAFFEERHRGPERFHRGIAVPLAAQLEDLLHKLPMVEAVSTAGEVRRGQETVAEVAAVVSLRGDKGKADLEKALHELYGVTFAQSTGEEIALTTLYGIPLRLVVAREAGFPTTLAWLTGSPEHWTQLTGRAAQLGFTFSADGVSRDGEPVRLDGEADLYRLLKLPPVPPEIREGAGEITTALEGKLPRLLEPGQIRGDLHLHSSWSDGSNTVEQMAETGMALGYEYIAVTDHSPSLRIAGGLPVEKLRRQVDYIKKYNDQNNGCHILSGVEVDILADGSLDLPDDLLAELDLVIASVHSNFRQSREAMTERICRAMEHPAVHILGHPTGRLLGMRGGYRVDVDELIARAAATGTILEINASPQRLDLPEVYMTRAREAGGRLAVNTDAHSVATMEDMAYGVTAARRGWLEAADVVNTLTRAALLETLQNKAP